MFEDFSVRIARGDRVGIIGPNGAGKSTLLKVLMGELAPDEGTVTLGTNLQAQTIDQNRADLKDDMTIMDVLTGGRGEWIQIGDESRHIMTYLKDFLFDPSVARTPVSSLSGGERNRLLIAAKFAKPSNLLVLDEPTNDLDMDTLDLLQEVLADYKGTILLVSHDRDFLDRVVTSSIVLEGDGTATEYSGGYSDYKMQQALTKKQAVAEEKAAKSKVLGFTSGTKKKAKKLSYKDQRALDSLPAEIESLTFSIAQMEAEVADPELYTKNPDKFNQLTKDADAARAEIEKKEMRWLELEEMKDALNR
ncbi:MAG: ATP-binding cassette domain-containing protein [Kordiimonadaceae bacterium]|nr:ATP-binding cassette domain-containing protein [Kordiimonadaceae bacterium]